MPVMRLYVNAVYIPSWDVQQGHTLTTLRTSLISHVIYAAARVRSNGTIDVKDETNRDIDGHPGCLAALVARKQHEKHLKVLLSVCGRGSQSEPFATIANSVHGRDRFGRSALEIVEAHRLDGIDLDWDYPATAAQGQDYVHLLAAIRRHLPASRFTLTSVLPVATLALSNLKVGALHEFLDFINVMTYDFSGPWVETVGHHAQLFTPVNPHHESASLSCQSAVSYLCMEGVPSQKIVLGIPAYGRSFLGAVNIGQRFAGHGGEHGTFLYKDLPRPGASEFVDEQVGAAYCIGGDGGFVSYDNPQTVALKARYVVMADLGGLFYWTGAGDSPGRKSLVETGFVHLHSSG